MVNNYYFVIDASAFEKGLGNIKRWDQWLNSRKNTQKKSKKVHIQLYVPTFTIGELEFLQFRRRSNNAREALKFIEQHNLKNSSVANQIQDEVSLEIIMEYQDILSTIPWSEVNIHHVDRLNKIPKRFKDLLKSCAYKCRLSNDAFEVQEEEPYDDDIIEVEDVDVFSRKNNVKRDKHTEGSEDNKLIHKEIDNNFNSKGRWILITEDSEVRQFADLCDIPHCSIVQVDSLLSKDLNDKTFKDTRRFNDLVLRSGIKQVSSNGNDIVKTKFKKTIYASRGSGKLWTP